MKVYVVYGYDNWGGNSGPLACFDTPNKADACVRAIEDHEKLEPSEDDFSTFEEYESEYNEWVSACPYGVSSQGYDNYGYYSAEVK